MRNSARFLFLTLFLLSAPLMAPQAHANTENDYAYFGFEPDIITNYISNTPKLGYVRVAAEIMIEGNKNLEIVEHHAPLLRAALIEILGQQTGEHVKTLAGREEIRQQCLNKINEILTKETGKPLAADLLFTKFLYL